MIRKIRPPRFQTDPLTERHLRRAGVPAKVGSGSIWKPFATRIRSQAAQTAPPATQPAPRREVPACLQRALPLLGACSSPPRSSAPPLMANHGCGAAGSLSGRLAGGAEARGGPAPHVFTSSSYLACLAKKKGKKKGLVFALKTGQSKQEREVDVHDAAACTHVRGHARTAADAHAHARSGAQPRVRTRRPVLLPVPVHLFIAGNTRRAAFGRRVPHLESVLRGLSANAAKSGVSDTRLF